MGEIELFFDRTVGKAIPEAMRTLGLKNVYHHHTGRKVLGLKPIPGQKGLFRHDDPDDVFLEYAGKRGWFVIGQDHSYHLEKHLLAAIKDHNVGVFYIWGANAKKWDTLRCIARSYPSILEKARTVPRPFIFKIGFNGRCKKIL